MTLNERVNECARNLSDKKLLAKLIIASCIGDVTFSSSQIQHKAFEGWDLLGLITWISLVSSVSSAAVVYPFTTFYQAL